MGDLAARNLGADVCAMAEKDPQARGVLRHQFPGTPIFNDVKEVTSGTARAVGFAGLHGMVLASSPCQGLSTAGKRGGLNDTRSGLWWEVVRICDETQTEWLVWENVPGALSSNGGRDFGVILGSLAELGMGFAWRVLDSQFFGVPQRRRRVFLVARRASDGADCAEVLSVGEGLRGHSAAIYAERTDIAADPATVVGVGGSREREVVSTLQGGDQRGYRVDAEAAAGGHLRPVVFTKGRRAQSVEDHETWDAGRIAPTLNAYENATESRATVCVTGATGEGASGGQHGVGVRRLTPLEAERLMGLPDDWTRFRIDEKKGFVEQADSSRYRQCGNGLAVPVMEWILRRVQGVIQ
jgi:DNA (cytosine-5)-methyltransferase 1